MSITARNLTGSARRTGSAYGTIAVLVVLGAVIVILAVKVARLNGQLKETNQQLTEAKAATVQVQGGLAKEKEATAAVKAQLEKANIQVADMQSQVEQAKEATARVQSLADDEKTQMADVQSQLTKAKSQISDLQTQINDDASGSAALLDQTKAQVGDLQTQLKKAQDNNTQLQSWFQKAHHLPVTTSFERVAGGSSFTLHVTNLYAQPLGVAITITGAVKTRSQDNSIDGGATLDVDKLTAGENVVISAVGYDPVTLSVQ